MRKGVNGAITRIRFWKSRKVAKFSFGDVFVHFGQQFIQLAGGDVAFHLLVPLIVLPMAKTTGDLRALFERQRGNRSLDFSNRAHAGKLSPMGKGVNAAKFIIVVQARLKCHQAKLLTGIVQARRACLLRYQNQRQELSPQFFPNLCISTDHRLPQAMFRSTARV
jgi:hypothetical protein